MILIVLVIFVLSYGLLIFRRIGSRRIPIWLSMVVGGLLMVLTFSISITDAFNAIDFRVISFLFGVLVLTAGLEKSGLIEYFVLSILRRAKGSSAILFTIIFGSGFLSAFLVNDTVAVMFTPVCLGIASRTKLGNDKVLLLPLAFGVTVGSAVTPIGNPQNLLVALNSGMSRPFSNFIEGLTIPTILSLLVVFLICKLAFRKSFLTLDSSMNISADQPHPSSAISDRSLAKQSSILFALLIASFAIIEIFPALQGSGVTLYSLAFAYGLVLLLISPRRSILLANLGWGVLIFFAGMFVLMRAVWNSGIGTAILSLLPSPANASKSLAMGAIMTNSILLSQILSNVPFVQLYTYQMQSYGFGAHFVNYWLALAAGSTLAGNLSLLGAVSNVIIMDAAENRGRKPFSFLEFLALGAIVTVATGLIYYLFLVV